VRVPHLLAISIVLLLASSARAEDAKSGPALPPMAQQMQEMQRSMDQLRETTDPARRRMLMGQHMAQMRATMQAMHGMMNCPGGEQCSGAMGGGGGMMNGGAMMDHMSSAPIEQQLDAMRQRQDAMQSMMEQMLQHQEQMLKN